MRNINTGFVIILFVSTICFCGVPVLASAPHKSFSVEKTVFHGDAIGIEFNQRDCLAVWQDSKGFLRLASVDPDSGDLYLFSKIIDTNLAPRPLTKNGPEWLDSDIGMQIVYTKLQGNRFALYRARILNDLIETGPIEGGENGFSPIGSLDYEDSKPRIVYAVGYPGVSKDDIKLYWQEVYDPIKKGVVSNNPGGPARWMQNSRSIVFTDKINKISQVFLLNIDTNNISQLTYDNLQKGDGYIYKYNNEDFLVVLEGRGYNKGFEYLSVYRKSKEKFVRFRNVRPPSSKIYFSSPQVFFFDAQPFVYFLMSDVPFPAMANGRYPTEIWVASLNPDGGDFYKKLNNSNDQLSSYAIEPEHFFLSHDVVIFYSVKGMNMIRYAETGFGPPDEKGCINRVEIGY